jgi:hypothetical protein
VPKLLLAEEIASSVRKRRERSKSGEIIAQIGCLFHQKL